MKTRRIAVRGVGLEVLEAGEGGRPLLLVHGFTGAKEDFADHVDALGARGWHVVAPDQRGHGASDHPAGSERYSLRIFAADVLGLADALGWRRFTLLGHSMGGMVVQHVALDAGHRLDGLVLMDTSHAAPDGIDRELVELGKAVVAEGGMQLLVETQRDREEGPLTTAAHLRMLRTRPGYAEMGERNTLRSSPDMWTTMVDEILDQPDRLDRLATLAVPTLVIVGEQDRPFLEHAERMAGAIPGARLVVIADAGHSPQFEAPGAWWAALTDFLDGIAVGEAAERREPAASVPRDA